MNGNKMHRTENVIQCNSNNTFPLDRPMEKYFGHWDVTKGQFPEIHWRKAIFKWKFMVFSLFSKRTN